MLAKPDEPLPLHEKLKAGVGGGDCFVTGDEALYEPGEFTFTLHFDRPNNGARGVYPTQDTSRMGTATAKQEEETWTRREKVPNKA